METCEVIRTVAMRSSSYFMLLFLLAGALAAIPANLQAQAASTPAANQTQTPSTSQAQTPAPAQPTQKKVWTNDDIDQLRGEGGLSVVGVGNAPAPSAAPQQKGGAQPPKPATAARPPKEKDPEWYKQQLAPLYTQLDRINDEIAAAQSAADGETRGDAGVSLSARAPAGTPEEQLVQLQKQQQEVQNKIDDLLDMARHNGIEPGALR